MKKRNRYWGLTVPYNMENVGGNILDFIENKLKNKDILNYTYACSNLEIGDETDYLHYHLLIRFENAVQIDYVKNIFGDLHLENIANVKAYLNYISKTGLLFCNINIEANEDISKCILEDIENGFNLKQLIYKYPKYAMYHFNQLKELYNFLLSNKEK